MATEVKPSASFGGLEVAAFESRRAKEIASLISSYGGIPRIGPSMREVPLEENAAAFRFAGELLSGGLDAVIFMTGVGARTLIEVLRTRYPLGDIVQAFSKLTVVARGPKPIRVLQEFQVPVTISIPEPNTWREILQELDESPRGFTLKGSRVAVQEYGASNEAFLRELKARGAEVIQVPVYRWALPEDVSPLVDTLQAILARRARIVLFTNAVQVDHALRVASERGFGQRFVDELRRCVVCSVGPTCSEALVASGIAVDLEPAHPKMGVLVHDAARQAPELLRRKSESAGSSGGNPGPAHLTSVASTSAGARAPEPEGQPWVNSNFMRACRREPTDATPVWLMRQVGRYMKEYRDLRARVPFLELCKNPDLVTELTLTAVKKLEVDAAIIFADLLLIAEPLGFGLEYNRGEGPVVTPALRKTAEIERMPEVNHRESLGYFFDAIRQTRSQLDRRIPLIGFGAAPFTLASYLIEGGASKSFRHTKSLMYLDPGAWRALMERLTASLIGYFNGQIEAGVQAVQIFDTWVGCLGPADYRELVLPYTRRLVASITPKVPVIHFGTDTATLLEDMRDAGGDVIGLDFRVELDEAWKRLGSSVGVQGNLDPTVLYAGRSYIRTRVSRILDQAAGRPGHIFNLGHGILPDTPFESVLEVVNAVHEFSRRQ